MTAPHPLEIRTVLMCALLQAGHDVARAAAMLDQAEAAVLGRAERAAPEPAAAESHDDSTVPPARAWRSAEERLKGLDTAGLTVRQIAETLDITTAYAYGLCQKHGLEYRRAGRGADRKPRAKRIAEAAAVARQAPAGVDPAIAAEPFIAMIEKKVAAAERAGPAPESRARFPQALTRRCDCGQLFKTDIVDQTMCASCTENAARHREAQAGRTGA